MKTEGFFSPIALTVQDFMGALLPGMVWAVEFFTVNELAYSICQIERPSVACSSTDGAVLLDPSTFQIALCLVSGKTTAFYTGFVVCSLIIGYITNAFPTRLSEKVSFPVFALIDLSPQEKAKGETCRWQRIKKAWHRDRFPYDDEFFTATSCFSKTIRPFLRDRYDIDLSNLPGYFQRSPFNMCKKLLRSSGTEYVRDRVMYLESQVRMLSSLLLASISNAILALVAFLFASGGSNHASLFGWLLFSIITCGILAYTFQYRRHTEVCTVYSYALYLIKEGRFPVKRETVEREQEELIHRTRRL